MKVRRANLPIRALDEMQNALLVAYRKAALRTLDSVKNRLKRTAPDAMDNELMALEKATPSEIRLVREYYGSPCKMHQLMSGEDADKFLSFLSTDYGWGLGSVGKMSDFSETEISPYEGIPDRETDWSKVKDALEDGSEPVLVVEGDGGKVIVSGWETVLAARMVGVPYLEVGIAIGKTGREVEPTWSNSEFWSDRSVAWLSIGLQRYFIPIEEEPIARLARSTERTEFEALVRGVRPGSLEEELEYLSKRKMHLWKMLSKNAIALKKDVEQYLKSHYLWREFLDDEKKVLDREVLIQESFDRGLANLQKAEAEARKLAKDLGAQFKGSHQKDPGRFWKIAKVRINGIIGGPEENHQKGNTVETGKKVQVKDATGGWRAAEVLSYIDGVLKVKREDGQVRSIVDMDSVKGMAEVEGMTLPDFNVVIPKDSPSYLLEKALEPITEGMNRSPLSVNAETYERNKAEVEAEAQRLVSLCREKANVPGFRPNSSKDCYAEFAIHRRLGVRTTKGGTPSYDEAVLRSYQNKGDDLAGLVMEARSALNKSSQMKSWAQYVSAGTVQTEWNQYGTPHGRYTAENPNLQNRIVEIRETVEPPEADHVFLSFDWGMAEYVTFASLSKDASLGAIFASGKDLHAEMAEKILRANPKIDLHGTPERKAGKTVNFAILYLMKSWTLAEALGVEESIAQGVKDSYSAIAPEAMFYQAEFIKKAVRSGMTSTAFGRVRKMPELRNASGGALHALVKTAWHHHNAGTAAELLKVKMVELVKAIQDAGVSKKDAYIAFNMHDEVILSVKKDVLEEVKALGTTVMKTPVPGFLGFKIDTRVGNNWKEISK